MSQVMLPLVLPPGPWLDRVFRAVVGFALFTAAYLAEDVRGGLAAVGRGQMEAARAVGLGTAGAYRLVMLPQALRVVVPSIVGQFIALHKDTSLAQIVGLNELLGIAVAVVAQPAWRGRAPESLVFAASVYFVFSFAMARLSRHLEHHDRSAAH
jgi:general L-amino acid transport system permease protein